METLLQIPPQLAPEEVSSGGDTASSRFYSLLEGCAIPIGACVSLVAFLRFLTFSSRRLWFDEIYTAIITLQPTWADVWKAYSGGLDMQPPLFFGVTRVSTLLLGGNELALRFPEILGVLIFSWCMFFFVGKRMGVIFGLSAMILPLVTDLEFYAGEARPYGMLLAFGGLALLAWRNAIESPRRRVALPLFALSLALVAASHPYAIVTVAMFALAELARYLQKRRADWPLWTCFLAALLPLPFYWFGLQTAKGIIISPRRSAHWGDFLDFYHFFFRNRIGLVVLFGLLTIGLSLLRRSPKPRVTGFPLYEVVLAGILAVFPIFNITLAVFVTKLFFSRYSIFGMAGIVIVAILLVDAVAPSRRVASLALLFLSVFAFGMDQLRESFNPEKIKTRDAELAVPYTSVPAGMPLVIATGMAFMSAEMYGSDSDLARTFYLTDSAASLKYSGSTIFDTLPNLSKFHQFRAHFVDYRTFRREHKKFFAYGPYVYCDAWQVQKLIDDGARVVRKHRYPGELTDNFLFEVELP
jgi:hypothetical protein